MQTSYIYDIKEMLYTFQLWIEKQTLKPFVKVYSHPRSGTHFSEAFLGKNFYQKFDLSKKNITWGHWANRAVNEEGNPYQELFGSHFFPNKKILKSNKPMLYMVRDGRAVAYSIWKTANFIHPKHQGISFSDFLRMPLDWSGTPSIQVDAPTMTIAEHWKQHVEEWEKLASTKSNILIVRYEDLKDNPYEVYQTIRKKFFPKQKELAPIELDTVSKPIGLLPNKGQKDSWKSHFTEEDNAYFLEMVGEDYKWLSGEVVESLNFTTS
ncbi:sulfotransferase domain-containing protein [Algivirga pacifica]|uniref:Sulfotransferase domain-containing protein n=1 Tax=Algivirga pacifica TaxID=1162670 RepID=A0ABP9D4W6_9BACT